MQKFEPLHTDPIDLLGASIIWLQFAGSGELQQVTKELFHVTAVLQRVPFFAYSVSFVSKLDVHAFDLRE